MENMNDYKKYKKGFTMVEVIVVSAIVAILATAAFLVSRGYVTSAMRDNARAKLELIGAAVMLTHNRGIDITPASDWIDIGISDPSDENWIYTFDELLANVDPPVDYSITATGDEDVGTYKPHEDFGSRWTGIFLYLNGND